MEEGKASDGPQFGEKELEEYKSCPEVLYLGAHPGGFFPCVYCAEVYRRYRRVQNETLDRPAETSVSQAEEVEEEEPLKEGAKKTKVNEDGDDECTQIMCMRAGWCMCE